MADDSSRQTADTLNAADVRGGNGATLSPEGGALGGIAYQATLPDHRRSVTTNSKLPTSGRPDVAQLPVIEESTYHIEGEVAQGGIGRVLSARDTRLDRRVAVKVLLEESGAYEERFVREALVTARLQHPSIVPVYEAGRWPSGEPFYSMKLVSGQPLLDIIETSRSLQERLPLLTRVLAVADAVAYAHEKRIIHRDLKPANILIGSHGETMLIDWGLAKDLNESAASAELEQSPDPNVAAMGNGLTMMGSVMGTPAYMPPEQAAGDAVDERADVYALGAILYHLLSGKQPYDGLNGLQILSRVLEEPPDSLRKLQSGIAPDLLTIVDKAMAREPSKRYPTAKEFAEDLRRFLAGQLVGAHQYSPRERVIRFVRKHRAALGVAALAFVILSVNGAYNMSRIVRERDRAHEARVSAELAREQSVAAEQRSTDRADELTLVEARAAVERDPNAALAWLKALSPSFHKWTAARMIAADAWSRGVSTVYRGHTMLLNTFALSPDQRFFITASDDHSSRIFDVATGDSRVLDGHTDEVWSASFSPDGKVAATASKDTSIRIWDLASGKTIQTLNGHKSGIVYVIFSADSKRLFTQSDDCSFRVWDLSNGTGKILSNDRLKSLKSALSPDQKAAVTIGADSSVWWLDIETGASERLSQMAVNGNVLQVGGRFPIVFSPDGSFIASGGADGLVRIWDIAAKKLRVLEGQTVPVVRVAISPDAKQLAAASFDGSMRLWNLQTGLSLPLASQDSNVRTLEFSPDGRKLAAGGYDRALRVIDLSTGKRRRFVGMKDSVTHAFFSKDSARLFVASGDGSVHMFQLAREPGRTLGSHLGGAYSVDVSARGDRIVSAGQDGIVRIWSLNGESEPISLVGHVGSVANALFTPSGELVVSSGADGTVRLWDISGHQIRAITVEQGSLEPRINISPDGMTVAIGDVGGVVRKWDIDSGHVHELGRHSGAVHSVRFSPDGRKLGSASADDTAKVWDLATGRVETLAGHQGNVDRISFSPDSSIIATGSADHRLRFWDSRASAPRTYDAGGFTVRSLSFLPDGKSILTHGGESTVRLWDVSTGKTKRVFRGHRGMITSMVLNAAGTTFVTGSDDRTTRLFDIQTGESRVLGAHEGIVRDVGLDPNGNWAVSAGDDGAIRVWPDDLPRDPEELRAWIDASVSDAIDVEQMGEGSVPLP